MEEQDFRVFDRLREDAVKKFYEVRVSQSLAEEGKHKRLGGGRRGGRIIRLPALRPDLDISGQHSEEKKKRRGGGPGEGWREY